MTRPQSNRMMPIRPFVQVAGRVLVRLVTLLMITSATAYAQFSIPLPSSYDVNAVRQENEQLLFLRKRDVDGKFLFANHSVLRDLVNKQVEGDTAKADFDKAVAAHCARRKTSKEICLTALSVDSLKHFLGNGTKGPRPIRRVFLQSFVPLRSYSRPELAELMVESGGKESLAFASQFSANVSDTEAYVVSNIVRGLAGRAIFSADYALVVVRSDSANPALRDTVESDKSNLLRAVNNGGTLVARVTAPLHAWSGANLASASGLTLSGGFIGPIAGREDGKRHAAVSGAAEFLGSFSIRNLNGTSDLAAELIFGARAGYTLSDGPMRLSGGTRRKDVAFGQFVIGLRQNGTLSLSTLLTFTDNDFNDLLPRVVLNFAAIR